MNKIVLEQNKYNKRAYPEYQFKPIIIGHGCAKLKWKLSIFKPVFEIVICL